MLNLGEADDLNLAYTSIPYIRFKILEAHTILIWHTQPPPILDIKSWRSRRFKFGTYLHPLYWIFNLRGADGLYLKHTPHHLY